MNKKNEFIAYTGKNYTIEWYFDERGISQPLDYLMKLRPEIQKRVFYLVKRMGDNGKINDITKFRYEGEGIYVFKPQPHRFLAFFFKGERIIITNAFRKKSEKLPVNEMTIALKKHESYMRRVNEGTYYEED